MLLRIKSILNIGGLLKEIQELRERLTAADLSAQEALQQLQASLKDSEIAERNASCEIESLHKKVAAAENDARHALDEITQLRADMDKAERSKHDYLAEILKLRESLETSRLENAYILSEIQRVRTAYIDLIQQCIIGSIYKDASSTAGTVRPYDPATRDRGLDWPLHAHTMIGQQRLHNLRRLVESVIGNNIPGDLIETGVWRGGACILMRAVLHAYRITDRLVWVADSFAGLPEPDAQKYPADTGSTFHQYPELTIPLEEVQENFRAYGLLDGQVKFLKGWFKDTLPSAEIKQLALIRLDGDMYESTMDGLVHLYPKLSTGGYIIIDDYHLVPACKAAVHDYCSSNSITLDFQEIDGVGIYWKKSLS